MTANLHCVAPEAGTMQSIGLLILAMPDLSHTSHTNPENLPVFLSHSVNPWHRLSLELNFYLLHVATYLLIDDCRKEGHKEYRPE